MALEGGGGGGGGQNLHALGLLDNKSAASSDKPAESMGDLVTQILDMAGQWASKFGFVPKGIGKVNMFGGTDLTQAGIRTGSMVTQSWDARGGAVPNALAQVFSRPDFSGLGPMPQGDPMTMNSGVEVSPSELGSLPVQSIGDMAMGRGAAMDLG